jgi:hypothetical protein
MSDRITSEQVREIAYTLETLSLRLKRLAEGAEQAEAKLAEVEQHARNLEQGQGVSSAEMRLAARVSTLSVALPTNDELILIRECVRTLDCGALHCRYCRAESGNGWDHSEHCPYADSQRKVKQARTILDRLQQAILSAALARAEVPIKFQVPACPNFIRLQHAGQWQSDSCAQCGRPEAEHVARAEDKETR